MKEIYRDPRYLKYLSPSTQRKPNVQRNPRNLNFTKDQKRTETTNYKNF